MDYFDFELAIDDGDRRDYPISVIRSPAGEAREIMTFPFGELELENQLQALEIALLRSGGKRRKVPSPQEKTVQKFGKTLFNILLSDEVRSRYDMSFREANEQGKGLRIKLRIRPPELAALPWEFMYDERHADYVVLSRETPLVRYLELSRPISPLTIESPLRIIGMIASPSDLDPLDVGREKERVERAVEELRSSGAIELTWLEGHGWRDLQKAMRRGPWHVFHFIGHGGFDTDNDEGLIALANEEGNKHLLSATELARLLVNHGNIRLALLNSCDGAKGGNLDIYSSTAAILVKRGIPAVIAMQYEITDSAAIEFARGFYESLVDGLPVDAAVSEARTALSVGLNNTLEWGTPVLYMRSSDGVLFNIEKEIVRPVPREGDAERERAAEAERQAEKAERERAAEAKRQAEEAERKKAADAKRKAARKETAVDAKQEAERIERQKAAAESKRQKAAESKRQKAAEAKRQKAAEAKRQAEEAERQKAADAKRKAARQKAAAEARREAEKQNIAEKVDAVINADGETLLMIAARSGKLEEIKRLVELGGNPLKVDRWGETVRQKAMRNPNKKVLKYIESILGVDRTGVRPAEARREAEKQNKAEKVDAVINADGETLLMIAARSGKLEEIKRLVELGGNPLMVDRWGETVRQKAMRNPNKKVLIYIESL